MIDLIILANLLDGPKHGYALKKSAGMVFAHSDLHNNLVYPLLRRFTAQGWVSRKSAPGERGQTRQQYALTPAGRRVLLQRLQAFGEKEAHSSEEFLLRVGLFELLPPAAREHILEARRQVLAAREEHFAKLLRMELGIYGAQVVEFLQRGVKHELTWLRRLAESLPLAERAPASRKSASRSTP
jgi:DNA-binding PadR family transcriptional regulator